MTESKSSKRPTRLNKQLLTSLYQTMLRIRKAEEKIAQIYPTDKIQSPIHLCIGQEAVSAGVCLAMKKYDHLYGTYRGHGIYLAKGGDMKQMFAELYAKDTGCSGGKGGSMHLIAPEVGVMGCSAIVASTIPLAVGDALASKTRKENRVSVAFFGDGAVDEGVFFESLNFAALKKLPVIFVCENNNYAVHSRVSDRHLQTQLYRYGESLGIPGKRFDGNDAATVYSSMLEAVERVRKTFEPLLIEYTTYRLYEHVGPIQDHNEAYREMDKLRKAQKHDPIKQMKAALIKKHKISEKVLENIESEVLREIEEAVKFADKSPVPPVERLYQNLYAVKS